MSDQHDEHEERGSLWKWVAFAIALPAFYVLSYATAVKYSSGLVYPSGIIVETEFYKPVDWLIDCTPLHDPLLAWAELNGVRDEFESSSIVRRSLRDLRKHH